jgi:hypothetical protein
LLALDKKTGEPLSENERTRWEFAMQTEIQRSSGGRLRFGSCDR